MKGVFIFRRDLRLGDNTGLNAAKKECGKLKYVFILDERQADPKMNPFYSEKAFAFMLEAIKELKKKIAKTGSGSRLEVIKRNDFAEWYRRHNIECMYANKDYTPFAIRRDEELAKIGQLKLYDDYYLFPPGTIKPYKVFTPYYNVVSKLPVARPTHVASMNVEAPKGYSSSRDFMLGKTSGLSPYIKFGLVSIRQVWWANRDKTFRKELIWRDFYAQIAYYFPHVLQGPNKNFRQEKIKWENDPKLIRAWKAGKTGVPLVDAAMRELNETGRMPNRARMVVSNVLTKLFKIDWRIGEQYFAQRLVDYDPASNNGGWQWSSGTGADAQPYYRVFNPYVQAEKYDPDAEYIKKWCPEYRGMTAKEIFAVRSELFDYEAARSKRLH